MPMYAHPRRLKTGARAPIRESAEWPRIDRRAAVPLAPLARGRFASGKLGPSPRYGSQLQDETTLLVSTTTTTNGLGRTLSSVNRAGLTWMFADEPTRVPVAVLPLREPLLVTLRSVSEPTTMVP